MTSQEAAQMDALVACAERAEQLFPALKDRASLEDKAGETTDQNWRVGNDGHFVLEMPNVAAGRSSPMLFTCAGNVERRSIELIELEGVTKRPPAGEVWSF